MIPGITYLNWAGLAPLTVKSYMHSLFVPELMGNILLPNWVKRVDKLREDVALWLGCHSEQVAFVPSTLKLLQETLVDLNQKPWKLVLRPAQQLIDWAKPFGWEIETLQRNDYFAVGTMVKR